MSQSGTYGSGGGPTPPVIQIDGDTGFANGPIINLVVGQSYGTSRFIGDNANTINLTFSDVDNNTGIGVQAFIQNPHGIQNVALGDFSGSSNTTGNDNVFIGYASGSEIGRASCRERV